VIEYWYPFNGHPDGESDRPWFRVVDGVGYRAEGNPAGESDKPMFGVVDGWAYPTLSLPGDEPTFEVVGSFVYAPQGTAWFIVKHAVR
jgi:hypothetical protein